MPLTVFLIAIAVYISLLAFLWGWSIIHAITTPKVDFSRRGLWVGSLAVNPLAAMWYWYIWKRWAFWALFLPAIVFTAFLPVALEQTLRILSMRDVADRFVAVMEMILTYVIDDIPLAVAVPLFTFPFIFRLAALTHLGGNSELEAADRNDHAVTFALPFFGFGASMTYCLKWRKGWAVAGLIWFVSIASVAWLLLVKQLGIA
jgi:hypothetical protein